MNKVVIVGGVAGGATAAARLRRLREDLEIVMFEKGAYISYANCGLPYYIGGDITDKEDLTLQTPESFHRRFNIDVRIQSEVLKIDPDKKTVLVKNLNTMEEYEETYDKLILSPGAEPIRPPFPGADLPQVFTLRTIPDMDRIKNYIREKQPKTAVVVGGGYIGVEMVENLVHAGLQVTLIEGSSHVIAPLDEDMAAEVHTYLWRKGVNLILKDSVTKIESKGQELLISTTCEPLSAEMVLLSVGVRPENKLAKEAGLQMNERGAIVVSPEMLTSNKDIYAVGDAIEILNVITQKKDYIPLAGPANKQGRIAADQICGLPSTYAGTLGTGILKCFDLTIATTGITEKKAQELHIPYEKSFTYSGSNASYYPGGMPLSMKLIFHKETGKVLGAQIIGVYGVDKRIDVIATAMNFGATVYDLTKLELAYAPPYSSAKDPVNIAGYVAENILTGKTKVFHHHQLKELMGNDQVTLLDIRTRGEFSRDAIPGSLNIPVDSLRDRLDEIDPNKPVYVICQVGLRGHVACRILSQNGYDCYNLSGGFRIVQVIYENENSIAKRQKTAPCGKPIE